MRKLFVILCLLISSVSFAAIESTVNSLSATLGNPIALNATLSLTDQWYPFPTGWAAVFAVEGSEGAVVLRYDDALRTYTTHSWLLIVKYDVVTTNSAGSTTLISNETLQISYDPETGIRYTDRDKKVYPGAHKIAITVNASTGIDYTEWDAGGTPVVGWINATTIPAFLDDIYLDLEMNVERYYNLEAATPTTIFTNYQSTTNELNVAWNYIQGAESYDLEWLFIDMGNEVYPYTTIMDFDWRNATRVNVPNQFYDIPLAFPRGILVMRVRGVGIDWDNYQTNSYITRGEGVWTTTGNTGNTSTYSGARYDLEFGLLPLMNWSYSSGFAEDGKRMDGAEFYDGMMRGREAITTVNTDGNVIIGQTIYDFEGRPAAGVLPYPQTSEGITFYVADQDYDCNDFDTDITIEAPATMTSGGAGTYYSATSPTVGMDAAVPDAEGYPYARVVYMNDGTNRPVKSGAAGDNLGLNGSNETQYFYGTASQYQLDRLFGNEVGYASHYKKNFVIDPNGVVSVSYIDQSGNVIATALAGEAPDNLEAIDNPNGNPNTAVSMYEGLLVNNGPTTNGDGTESMVTLTVTEESDYDFVYVLNSAAYCGEDECYDICKDCVYDVKISVINAVSGDSIDIVPAVGTTKMIKEYATTAEAITFTVTLTPGTYRVQKRTILNQAHLADVRQDFLDAQLADPETSCVPLVELTPIPCAADCHEACELHYLIDGTYYNDAGVELEDQGNESTDAGPMLIAACQATLCDAPIVTDPCELKYQAMVSDMSPGGQYFDNLPDQFIYNETTGSQTINTEYNEYGWLSAHDKSSTMIAAINAVWGGTDFTNWTEVKADWDEDWAELLVPYHPEYCTWNYFCNWSCEYIYDSDPPHEDWDTIVYTQSYSWEYEMATLYNTDGHVSGSDGDYWNPLNMTENTSLPGVDGDNSGYLNYDENILNQDPRFAGDCDFEVCDDPSITATDLLEDYLQNFFLGQDETDANLPYHFSIWYVIEDPDDIHLGDEDANLNTETVEFFEMLHGDGTTEGLIDATPTAGQVTPYQFFRSVYFYYRTLVIEQGFAGDAGVASCRSTYADDDVPVIDTDGYLVSDDDYPSLTPEGFPILYMRNTLIDIYGGGCDNPTQGELVTLLEGLVEDAAENPNEIDNEVPTDIGCTCQMLIDFAEARGIGTDPGDYGDIAAALNDEYDPATPYTGTDVGNWFTTCAVEEADVDDLITYNFPEELICTIDIGIANLSAAAQENCEQENYDLAAYNAYFTYTNNVYAAADDYMEAYTAACLDNLTVDEGEEFSVTYDLHEYYYTLYYYDQAGNLVKTVPPEGVNLINLAAESETGPGDGYSDGEEITIYRDDFRDGTTTTSINFTPAKHDMKSRYAYNSLQQPINASQNEEGQTGTYESGETSFWYDYLGRMVVSQNSKQAAMGTPGYSYTLYDPLGRVYEVGELHTTSTLETDNTGSRGSDDEYYFFDVLSSTTLETWIAGASSKNDVTFTYYDVDPSISSDATAAFPSGLENTRNRVTAVVYDDDPTVQYDLYNFSASSQPDYLSAYFYSYDIHGNVKQVVQETPPLKTHNQNIKSTTYEYDLISGNVNAVHYQDGERDEFHHKYEYDADNRLKVVYTSRDNVHWEKEQKQFYYATGGVGRVEIGDKTVQAMDYAFTINGWLKGMNRNTIGDNGEFQERDLGQDGVDDANNLNRNIGTDAAGFTLSYYQAVGLISADYTSVNATPAFEADMSTSAYGTGISNQYNGNIAGMTTSMLDADEYGTEVQGRAFRYDQLYRIKWSTTFHMDGTALTNNEWQTSYTQNDRFEEEFWYDWNGNITNVNRFAGNVGGGGMAVKSDSLSYKYKDNSNILLKIMDGQGSCSYSDDLDNQGTGGNYVYDVIGEMTDDASERITDIEWNPYGKVKAVRKDQANNTNACTSTEYGDADVEFLYTAGQQRLCKIVKPHKASGAGIDDQTNWIYYWYVYDAGGNLMGVYKQSFEDLTSGNYKVKIDLEENGVYGSGRAGIRHADDESDYYQDFTTTLTSGKFNSATPTASTGAYNKTHYTRTIGYKQYEVSNHLGNVLVTISDKRLLYSSVGSPTEVEWYVADVQSYSDYYVFGAPQTGRAGGSYRYAFNGMESDPEIKNGEALSYTTEYRQYDPRIGRWMSKDPIVKPWESPYSSFANNPIYCVDPSGLDAEGWIKGTDGKVRFDENVHSQGDVQNGEKYLGETISGYVRMADGAYYFVTGYENGFVHCQMPMVDVGGGGTNPAVLESTGKDNLNYNVNTPRFAVNSYDPYDKFNLLGPDPEIVDQFNVGAGTGLNSSKNNGPEVGLGYTYNLNTHKGDLSLDGEWYGNASVDEDGVNYGFQTIWTGVEVTTRSGTGTTQVMQENWGWVEYPGFYLDDDGQRRYGTRTKLMAVSTPVQVQVNWTMVDRKYKLIAYEPNYQTLSWEGGGYSGDTTRMAHGYHAAYGNGINGGPLYYEVGVQGRGRYGP